MKASVEFPKKMAMAYDAICRPLCQELKLPQTALDILLFLANNPVYQTAGEIVSIRKLRANLVSVNVERLVEEGYLTREAVAGDRRKTLLRLTERAAPVVQRGREIQEDFFRMLVRGVSPEEQAQFLATMTVMEQSLDEILKERG